MTRCHLALVALSVVLGCSTPAGAQPQPTPPPAQPSVEAARATPTNVISANPFGLLAEFVNVEFERRTADTVSVGVGASTFMHEDYVNGDVFLRYYPGGHALRGASFGMKVGLTQVPDQATFLGVGFDANRSWLLNDHFYLGAGFGLKRLIGADESDDIEFIPTFRLNVGVAF